MKKGEKSVRPGINMSEIPWRKKDENVKKAK